MAPVTAQKKFPLPLVLVFTTALTLLQPTLSTAQGFGQDPDNSASSFGSNTTANKQAYAPAGTRGAGAGAGTGTGAATGAQTPALSQAQMDQNAAEILRKRAAEKEGKKPVSNLFQTFVEKTTGHLFPIYAQHLFEENNPLGDRQLSPVPAEYIVGPGDEILLKIYGGTIDSDQHLIVDRQGVIVLPKIGPVSVTGVHVGELETFLKNRIKRVLTNFNLFVTMGQLRGIEVYLVGHARNPGKHILNSLSTVINTLFEVGGPSANGTMRGIQLVRNNKVVTTVDLYDFLSKGDTSKDRRLMSGDVINIPPAGPRVALTGAIPEPAIFEVNGTPPTSLKELLPLAGGISTQTSTLKVTLERIEQGRAKTVAIQNIALDDAGLKTSLKDGDVLTFYPFKPSFENAVTLRITRTKPIRVPIGPSAHIKDIIPNKEELLTNEYYLRQMSGADSEPLKSAAKPLDETDRIRLRNELDQISWDQAIIERKNPTDLSLQVISFNLGKAILGAEPADNVELQPGDIITVYSQRDIQTPIERRTRIVRVQGEIKAPGVYQLQTKETLPALITRAGGITTDAYVFGTHLSRQSVKEGQKSNIQIVIRQLESQLVNQNASSGGTATEGEAFAQHLALVDRNTQATRSQIARLQDINPNGRVSLELSDDGKAYPDFELEDGDEVSIPPVPGFVSAIGAVYNDNVLVYREGRRVSEYLEVAGLSDSAEPDNIFVLRANGSIVSSRSTNVGRFKLSPGDTIVVPEKYFQESGYSSFMRGLKDWTSIFFNFGLGAAAIKNLTAK